MREKDGRSCLVQLAEVVAEATIQKLLDKRILALRHGAAWLRVPACQPAYLPVGFLCSWSWSWSCVHTVISTATAAADSGHSDGCMTQLCPPRGIVWSDAVLIFALLMLLLLHFRLPILLLLLLMLLYYSSASSSSYSCSRFCLCLNCPILYMFLLLLLLLLLLLTPPQSLAFAPTNVRLPCWFALVE